MACPLKSLVVLALALLGLLNASATAATVEKTLEVDGRPRDYLLHVPANVKQPATVVIVMHGGGGVARQVERSTRFDQLADKEGFVVVYPNGVDHHWNDGRGVQSMLAQRENVDDVKFLRTVIDDVAKSVKIDRGRIFATGISNGGFMSHRLAADASDLVAGIAPVVGGLAEPLADKFKPAHPVSILIIQGDKDPLVPIDGGYVALGNGPKRGKLISTSAALAKYVKLNGNQGEPTVSKLGSRDDTSVTISKYPDGTDGAKTWYYLIHNGGHAWPGRAQYAPQANIGKASQAIDATDVIWQFFKDCPSRAKAP